MHVDWQARLTARAQTEEKPVSLYMAFMAAHFPRMALWRMCRLKGRCREGRDALCRARFERQKEPGVIPDTAELPPPPDSYDWRGAMVPPIQGQV